MNKSLFYGSYLCNSFPLSKISQFKKCKLKNCVSIQIPQLKYALILKYYDNIVRQPSPLAMQSHIRHTCIV